MGFSILVLAVGNIALACGEAPDCDEINRKERREWLLNIFENVFKELTSTSWMGPFFMEGP